MVESFADILTVGGKSNSLGRTAEVINLVLSDKNKLAELYSCTFNDDAWVRMRAIDAIEKVGREHPDWLLPYIDRFQSELASTDQPSILWHLAQIYGQLELTARQKRNAITWLKKQLATNEVDWIVAAYSMKTLVQFSQDGSVPLEETVALLKVQQGHKSNTVVRTATKLLASL
jgi:hypothetical protein